MDRRGFLKGVLGAAVVAPLVPTMAASDAVGTATIMEVSSTTDMNAITSTVYYTQIELTDDDIRNLPTTPKEIIGPQNGRITVINTAPHGITWRLDHQC